MGRGGEAKRRLVALASLFTAFSFLFPHVCARARVRAGVRERVGPDADVRAWKGQGACVIVMLVVVVGGGEEKSEGGLHVNPAVR